MVLVLFLCVFGLLVFGCWVLVVLDSFTVVFFLGLSPFVNHACVRSVVRCSCGGAPHPGTRGAPRRSPHPAGLGSGWGGCFSEQQTGVKQTQDQVFELPAKSDYEFSEFFTSLEGMQAKPSALYDANYTKAVEAVQGFLDSHAGVDATAFRIADAWLAAVSKTPLTRADVLYVGLPWGALEIAAGAALPASMMFVGGEGDTEGGTEGSTEGPDPPADSVAWWELLQGGTFSNATLHNPRVPFPLSFATSPRWFVFPFLFFLSAFLLSAFCFLLSVFFFTPVFCRPVLGFTSPHHWCGCTTRVL